MSSAFAYSASAVAMAAMAAAEAAAFSTACPARCLFCIFLLLRNNRRKKNEDAEMYVAVNVLLELRRNNTTYTRAPHGCLLAPIHRIGKNTSLPLLFFSVP